MAEYYRICSFSTLHSIQDCLSLNYTLYNQYRIWYDELTDLQIFFLCYSGLRETCFKNTKVNFMCFVWKCAIIYETVKNSAQCAIFGYWVVISSWFIFRCLHWRITIRFIHAVIIFGIQLIEKKIFKNNSRINGSILLNSEVERKNLMIDR